MSHTTKINDTQFIHDGDFGEDVEILRDGKSFNIPFQDLKEFVAEWLRREKIASLEQADENEVFNL